MNRKWTISEIEYLENEWGSQSVPAIAKALDRTEIAITNKAWKLGLGRFTMSGDYITLYELFEALGYKAYTGTFKYFTNNGLPYRVQKVHNSKRVRVININSFWKWAEENKEIIDFSNTKENFLGKEPKWVAEKRKLDFINPNKKSIRKWTKEDDERLIFMCNSGKYSCHEIAETLNRSRQAISSRASKLNVCIKKTKSCKRISKETKEEIERLIKQGADTVTISKMLNVSQKTISRQKKKMYNISQSVNNRNINI